MSKDNSSKNELQLKQTLENKDLEIEQREQALNQLTLLYTQQSKPDSIKELVQYSYTMAPDNSKMYIAKIQNQILDIVSNNDKDDKNVEVVITQYILEWSLKEKKQFLINKIRLHYAKVLYQREEFRNSRKEVDQVTESAKEIDDKRLLVECFLLESQLIFESHNLTRAKASLTACRASANMVHVPSLIQAQIEYTAGMIHLAEKDFQIAFSYFFESFEIYHQLKEVQKASKIYVYMVLSKIMADQMDEASNLLTGRYGEQYSESSESSKFIKKIRNAYMRKSLVELSGLLKDNEALITKDKLIRDQIDFLYQQLLEKNILKLVKPYSKVEMKFLAQKLEVDENQVERKIGKMILDKKIHGSMDQENGVMIIMEKEEVSSLYKDSLEILENMDESVTALFERAKKIKNF